MEAIEEAACIQGRQAPEEDPDAGVGDAGAQDAGVPDASPLDAGIEDAGVDLGMACYEPKKKNHSHVATGFTR